LGRRSFLRKETAVAGTVSVGAAALLGSSQTALARRRPPAITHGDAAILRFLAALEILETDLWQQYNELGGIQDAEVPGGSGSAPYTAALKILDIDIYKYIHDNT
jgi:hypothetical protein